MTLKDTIPFMLADNYVDRMKAEYMQISIRCDGLRNAISKVYRGDLDINGKQLILMREQLKAMQDYRLILRARLENEGVEF